MNSYKLNNKGNYMNFRRIYEATHLQEMAMSDWRAGISAFADSEIAKKAKADFSQDNYIKWAKEHLGQTFTVPETDQQKAGQSVVLLPTAAKKGPGYGSELHKILNLKGKKPEEGKQGIPSAAYTPRSRSSSSSASSSAISDEVVSVYVNEIGPGIDTFLDVEQVVKSYLSTFLVKNPGIAVSALTSDRLVQKILPFIKAKLEQEPELEL
jgi:hypothetical protein